MGNAIVQLIVTTIISFIQGLGEAFVTAFQTIFMVETEVPGVYDGINDLGTFILVFFGISLGYGVIRWITGLFRREAR